MTYSRWLRVALGYLIIISLQIGVWALLAPRSFYDRFPDFGKGWASVDGPYNEHLIRDVGALNLALAVVLVFAAVKLTRQLVILAALATLAWGVPHLIYHLFNTEGLDSSEVVGTIVSLGLFAALPLALIVNSGKAQQDVGI
ncbi:MAG: hypothetical protein V3V01_06795 [Acidimicrobiales bacterium]